MKTAASLPDGLFHRAERREPLGVGRSRRWDVRQLWPASGTLTCFLGSVHTGLSEPMHSVSGFKIQS